MKLSIFLVGANNGWIIDKIGTDIQNIAKTLGYNCRKGEICDYRGEDICYHLDWHIAVPIPSAKHNSLFYTHTNEPLMERQLCSMRNLFDSYVCMSPEDAQYLIELGFPSEKVYGRILPVRNTYIKPLSVGIFSACYPDGRKNEQWLVDYCKQNNDAKLLNYVFVGQGWGKVCNELEALKCTYEWHNVSRTLPYEYQFQQNKLAGLNYYIYMGMDGGAMGTYDAYAQDVPLCVTYDGFHKAIPNIHHPFDSKATFFRQMDVIVGEQANRINFFRDNNPKDYVAWLLDVWQNRITNLLTDFDKKCISYDTVLGKKRDQYYLIGIGKIKRYLSWKILQRNIKKML